MPTKYLVCMNIVESNKEYRTLAIYQCKEFDPGFEIARLICVARAKHSGVVSISAHAYSPENCQPPFETVEYSIAATNEQLQALLRAVGEVNIEAAAPLLAEIVVGVSIQTVKKAGDVISEVFNSLGRINASDLEVSVNADDTFKGLIGMVSKNIKVDLNSTIEGGGDVARNVARETERAAENVTREAGQAATNVGREAERVVRRLKPRIKFP